MRRTNSKETMEAIKNAIMESYEAAEESNPKVIALKWLKIAILSIFL